MKEDADLSKSAGTEEKNKRTLRICNHTHLLHAHTTRCVHTPGGKYVCPWAPNFTPTHTYTLTHASTHAHRPNSRQDRYLWIAPFDTSDEGRCPIQKVARTRADWLSMRNLPKTCIHENKSSPQNILRIPCKDCRKRTYSRTRKSLPSYSL